MSSVGPRLNLRQRKFAELVATGVPLREAYAEAGYTFHNQAAVEASSRRLALHPEVRGYVRKLRILAGEPDNDPEVVAERDLRSTLATIREKREFLARIIRTPIGELTEQSDLCQELQRTRRVVGRGEEAAVWETEKVKMPNKLDAIRLDSLLAGELREKGDEEARSTNNVTISVDLLREIQERRAAAMARMGISLDSTALAADLVIDSPASPAAGLAKPEGHAAEDEVTSLQTTVAMGEL